MLPFVGKVREAGDGFADRVHDAGLRLGTWIVDAAAEAVALMRDGVDAVATNDPAAIVAARRLVLRRMRFRRKVPPPALVPAHDVFHAVLDELEPAKAGLSDVLPGNTPARAGRCDDALDEFVATSRTGRLVHAGWRTPELEEVWVACDEGSEQRSRAPDACRARARSPGSSSSCGASSSLLDPLEPFADAEDRFRRLRA